MSKHYQESRLEFRRKQPEHTQYPVSQGIVIYQYGGNLEECIIEARKVFGLGNEWKVIEYKEADV